MNSIDRGCKAEQFLRDLDIKRAKEKRAHMDGPKLCVKCGYRNDRKRQGYAVCSDCMEGVHE